MGMEGVVHCGVVTRATARSETHHDGQGRIWGFGTHRIAASLGACQRKRRARGCATLGGEREWEGGGDTIVSQISQVRGKRQGVGSTVHNASHHSPQPSRAVSRSRRRCFVMGLGRAVSTIITGSKQLANLHRIIKMSMHHHNWWSELGNLELGWFTPLVAGVHRSRPTQLLTESDLLPRG